MAEESALHQMLTKHFAPAGPDDSKAMMKSTSDLFRILDEHAPGKFLPEELYDVLTSSGFEDRLVGDVIVWSVVQVKRS